MTNSTETFWSVDGQSLQTYAFNITTLGGDREAPPDLRGEDTEIPYMPGAIYNEREVESRVITLGMWVVGANPDGSIPTNENQRRAFERNWRMLRRLLWRPRKQFTLTKRFWLLTADLEAGGIDTSAMTKQGDWALYTASALASYAGGLAPQMTGATRATFTVDLLLSDPYFYGDEIEVPFSISSIAPDPGPVQVIDVLGDDRTTSIEIEFQGPLTSPAIENQSEPQELLVRYADVVPDGESAIVNVKSFSAMHYPAGTPYKAAGRVQHEGSKFWLYIEPGETTLALTAQAGTGVATLRYRPVWL